MVSLTNLPFDDNAIYINNIKNVIVYSFHGLSFLSNLKNHFISDKIFKHNIIVKIKKYQITNFSVEELIPVVNIIMNLLLIEIDHITEVNTFNFLGFIKSRFSLFSD